MAASRAVSDIIPAIAAGRWMPQCSAAERKTVSTASSSKNFFSIVFRLTGPRGGRFSPATDVITF